MLRPGGVAIISDVHPELVLLGSAVKGEGPSGQPQLAACHRQSVAEYLRAALSAGLPGPRLRRGPPTTDVAEDADEPAPEPAREIGAWREWPWTLLDWAPEASRAAWNIPSVVVWHLERD